MNMNTYKIVLIGGGEVGKTSFVKALDGEEWFASVPYKATLGVEVHPLRLNNHPDMCFNMWDCAGQEQFGGLRGGYFIDSDMALVFVDLTSRESLTKAGMWVDRYREICPNEPILYVATKSDIATFDCVGAIPCSSKDGLGVNEVMRTVATMVVGSPSLPTFTPKKQRYMQST